MAVLYDAQNPRALEVRATLEASMDFRALDPELHLVIGGDGFMLRCVREHHSEQRIFLGLNCGRLGFLLNDLPADLRLLPELIQARHRVLTFPRIHMLAEDNAGNTFEARALNDIYLERMTGQTCHLRMSIQEITVVNEMVCDGMILSTALGSTAYSYSAGGIPCHPTLEVIQATPICPHVPRLSPLLLPLRTVIDVEVLVAERRLVRAVADGVEHTHIRRVRVSDASSPVRLAFFESHNFTATLTRKLLNV